MRQLIFGMVAAAGLAFVSASHAADRLVVGTSNGQIQSGDPMTGGFTFFGICGGPVRAMTQHGNLLFLGATFGSVYSFTIDTQSFQSSFDVGPNMTGLSAEGGSLYVSFADGTIKQLDITTGALQSTFLAPGPVNALLVSEGFVFVGGPDGAIYRASTADHAFNYFTCFCNGPITTIARDRNSIFVGDVNGIVFRFSADEVGGVTGAAFVQPGVPVTGLASFNGLAVVSDLDGNIRRVNLDNGATSGDPMTGPAGVSAMMLVRDGICAADFNRNGAVTGEDFDGYVTDFQAGGLACDFDGDGFVTGDDFDAFLLAFDVGC